jgi:hypothetical protein
MRTIAYVDGYNLFAIGLLHLDRYFSTRRLYESSLVELMLFVCLEGCTAVPKSVPRIDGSTPAAFEASWNSLVKTLNSEQQNKLNTAILLIGATKLHDSGFKGRP